MQGLMRWALVPLVVIGIGSVGGPTAGRGANDPLVVLPPAANGAPVHRGDAPGVAVAATPAWLKRVNQYRQLAGLPPVTANAVWAKGARLHSRYMVKNGDVTHFEDPANEWYTKAGETAGRYGNVMGAFDITASDTFAIDMWIQGPFHAVGILHAKLEAVGLGSYRESAGWYSMAATLDVIRGRDYQAPTEYPVKFGGPVLSSSFFQIVSMPIIKFYYNILNY